MSEELNFNILGLQQLLKDKDENSDESDDELTKPTASAQLGPANIGKSKSSGDNVKKDTYAKKPKNEKDIWDVDDIPVGVVYDTTDDPRMQPDYDISYKQSVTTEDIYLQMGNKTPATASCDEMIIKVKLPDEKLTEIEANITEHNFLDCRSSKYRLGLYLPHPVDSKTCNAKWDSKNQVLIITARMRRELDMLNL